MIFNQRNDKEAARQLLMAAVAVPGALWATSCLFLVFIGQKKIDHEDNEDDDDRDHHDDKYKEKTPCPVLVVTLEDQLSPLCAFKCGHCSLIQLLMIPTIFQAAASELTTGDTSG